MFMQLLIIGAALLTQTGPGLFGVIPEAVPTFHLTVDGADLGAVALINGRDWWDKPEADRLPAGGAGMRYIQDAPWQRFDMENLPRLPRGAVLAPEVPRMRVERLRKEWNAQGFEFVSTPAGEQPVRKVDMDLAKQAAADAARVAKMSAPENIVIGESATPENSARPDTAQPAWRGYLGHLLLIVIALVAGAVIVKVLIIGGEDGWERVG